MIFMGRGTFVGFRIEYQL